MSRYAIDTPTAGFPQYYSSGSSQTGSSIPYNDNPVIVLTPRPLDEMLSRFSPKPARRE